MAKMAVVKTGGKQYIVKENDEIFVDKIKSEKDENIQLETLAVFDEEGKVELGSPALKTMTEGTVIENVQGDKLRVARFKSKVRYRKVRGFRPQLTRIKIVKI